MADDRGSHLRRHIRAVVLGAVVHNDHLIRQRGSCDKTLVIERRSMSARL